jgi:hypothetical protein
MGEAPMPRIAGFMAILALMLAANLHAASYASRVVSYSPGTASPLWQNPTAALGAASAVTGENPNASNYFGFPNILSPFSPAYQGDEIVQIGEGGQLTVQLSNYAITGEGPEIGIFTNVGLIDSNYPNGSNTGVATSFGGGFANLSVSPDNINWIPLGTRAFGVPSLYFTNAGPYETASPVASQLTDFGLPFPTKFGCFDAADWTATANCFLNPNTNTFSAGGDWFQMPGDIASIAYVRLEIPDDNNPLTDNRLAIDTIAINNAAVGAPVPEPSTLLLVAASLVLLRRR